MATSSLHKSHHKRHHSWPPFHVHHFHHQKKDIDEDPFSHFLSEAKDGERYIVDYMTADVETFSPSPRPKSLSPHRLRKSAGRSHGSPTINAILKLKKWIERMEARYRHRKPSPSPQEFDFTEFPTPPMPISPPLRGRKTMPRVSKSVGNRMVRSHSGRPRVWMEPSRGIWPVMEEQEDVGLGISL